MQVLNIRSLHYKIYWFYSSAALSTRLEQSLSRWYFFVVIVYAQVSLRLSIDHWEESKQNQTGRNRTTQQTW